MTTGRSLWVLFPPQCICLGDSQAWAEAGTTQFWRGTGPGAPGSTGPVGIHSVRQGSRSPASCWAEALPLAQSVNPLHPLVVGVEGGFQVGLGRVGHPHSLQGVVPTPHEVWRDLVAEEEGNVGH